MISLEQVAAGVEKLEAGVARWKQASAEALQRVQNGEASTDNAILGEWRDAAGIHHVLPVLSEGILEDAQEVIELCHSTEIDREAWDMVQALDVVDQLLTRFVQAEQIVAGSQRPDGGHALDDAFKGLFAARRKPRVKRQPTPIKQLQAEGVFPSQIAKIYGWYLLDGNTRRPDIEKLQQEIDQPGRHYNADTWESPEDVKYWRQMQEWWDVRSKSVGGQPLTNLKGELVVEARAEWRPPQESVDELILQGVNAAQVAKMHRINVEEVHERAAILGVALDSNSVVASQFLQAQRERMKRDQERLQKAMANQNQGLETYPELGEDRDGRILRMSEDGVKARHISDALRREFPTITPTQVGMIVAKYRKEAEANAAPSGL